MMRFPSTTTRFLVLVLVGSVLTGCTLLSPPPLPETELNLARRALERAAAAGAEELVPTDFATARSALREAENQIAARHYEQARTTLAQAATLANQAEQLAIDTHQQRATEAAPPTIATAPPPEALEPRKPVEPQPKPKPHLAATYTVIGGETLWSIAQRPEVYDDPLLWPLLYQANRDQIKDPKQVHNGQVLAIPRNSSESEREEARNKAKKSDIFPVK